MKKALDKYRAKMNNKGFTLVELIIVIAIIAILIAVLAPQYTKYIERARKSNDITAAGNIRQAALTAALDPDNDLDSFTVTWATTATSPTITITSTAPTGKSNTKAEAAIQSVVPSPQTPQSQFAKNAVATGKDYGGNFVLVIENGAVKTNTWGASMGDAVPST